MTQQAHLDPAAFAVELLSGGNWKLLPELSGFWEEDDWSRSMEYSPLFGDDSYNFTSCCATCRNASSTPTHQKWEEKIFSKLQRMTNCLLYSYSTKENEKIIKVSITEDQMLPLNQLFKRKKKKTFCGPILVQLSPKQLKRLWKLYQLFLIYRFLWGYKKKCFTNCKQVPVNMPEDLSNFHECQYI